MDAHATAWLLQHVSDFDHFVWLDLAPRNLSMACRQEEFSIKMVTSDDEKTVDIIVQGDEEEIERMTKELGLFEKGKVYVPGLLEAVGNNEQA